MAKRDFKCFFNESDNYMGCRFVYYLELMIPQNIHISKHRVMFYKPVEMLSRKNRKQ